MSFPIGNRPPKNWWQFLTTDGVTTLFIFANAVVLFSGAHLEPWKFMWLIAMVMFATGKWISWSYFPQKEKSRSIRRAALYLLGWVGMDPKPFCVERSVGIDAPIQILYSGIANIALAASLVVVARAIPPEYPLSQAWVLGAALLLFLHFGLFTILAWSLRKLGFAVVPIMKFPIGAKRVSDFWGGRWNSAFTDLVHPYLFTPIKKKWGVVPAVLATFLFSGVVHDLVISVPAGGGWGLPTLYFLLQACGMFIERSIAVKRLGETGQRVWTYLVVVGPVFLLFHPPFMKTVILPFAVAMGLIG